MNTYSILLGLVALILLHAAWRERALDNRRDALALTVCGTCLGALVAISALLL